MTYKRLKGYAEWGSDIILNKTEYMYILGNQQDTNGQDIKCCTNYLFFGLKITQNGTVNKAIKERNMHKQKTIELLNSKLSDCPQFTITCTDDYLLKSTLTRISQNCYPSV